LKARGVKPNETIYKLLIEANSFCEMNDKALDLVIKLKDSKNDISPFAHGLYLEAIAKARDFKFKREKLKKKEDKKVIEASPFLDPNKNAS